MGAVRRLLAAAVLAWVSASVAFAQGGLSLSGVVVDSDGGLIPGAAVAVRNNATGESFEVATNQAGAFSVPAIAVGTYTVTITLHGFKTAVVNECACSRPRGEREGLLEVGALSETVEVKAGSELIQTQSTTVTATIASSRSRSCRYPRGTRFTSPRCCPASRPLPDRAARRSAAFHNNTINVTIDGVTTGNQLQSTDGFFSMVTPRLDAVEK